MKTVKPTPIKITYLVMEKLTGTVDGRYTSWNGALYALECWKEMYPKGMWMIVSIDHEANEKAGIQHTYITPDCNYGKHKLGLGQILNRSKLIDSITALIYVTETPPSVLQKLLTFAITTVKESEK